MPTESGKEGAYDEPQERGKAYGHAARQRRLLRGFAVFATVVMVLTAFAVLPRNAAASTTTLAAMSSGGATASTYSPGLSVSTTPSGLISASYLATFTRWDGAIEPYADLNFSTGQWPYLVNETATSLTVTRQGLSFTQGKIPGATYSYQSDRIKETIQINASFPSPSTTSSIFVPFSSSYFPLIRGGSVSLYNATLARSWSTAPFSAWDSASLRNQWTNAVASIQAAPGGFDLVLNTTVTAAAVYPLYLDPTWILGGGVGWGVSVFSSTTVDQGDGSVKLGWLADNFNDNTNELWTKESGTVTFANGVMSLSTNTAVHAGGSWTDQEDGFQVEFTSSSGATTFYTQYSACTFSGGGYYALVIDQTNQRLQFVSCFLGFTNVIGSKSVTITRSAWYTVKLVDSLELFTVYWTPSGGSQTVWSVGPGGGTLNPGNIRFSTDTSAQIAVDSVRVWNTATGSLTTPIRNAGSNRPLQVALLGTADPYNQLHVSIRSSSDNSTWLPWANLKADAAPGIAYSVPDQDRLQYYRLQVTETTGSDSTPSLTEISTTEGSIPSLSPTANTGLESWYPYAGGLVNLVSGNLYYSTTDLSFHGKGFSLAVVRSYNSLLASQGGPFGSGWTFNYAQTLTINGNGNVTWNGPDGSSFMFIAKGSTGGFSPPSGVAERLVKNADSTLTLWAPDGSSEHFGSTGVLVSTSDRNGNVLTLSYSGGSPSLLTKVTDATGEALSFSYDTSHRIIAVTDPSGRNATYTYGSSGLATYADPLGNKWQYTYYSGTTSYLEQMVDPVGKSTLANYVSGGQVASLWLQSVNPSTLTINWQSREYALSYNTSTTRAVQNARGYWTTVTLNSFGNPVSISGPSIGCSCDASGNSSTYAWDGEMNQIQRTEGRGNTWLNSYGLRHNLLTSTDPGGNVSSETWYEVNTVANYWVAPATMTSYRGFTTSMGYTISGNLASISDPGGNMTLYFYDASGFLNKTVTPLGYPTWFVYNASGYLVKREDALSETTTYAYDILGRQTAVTDPMGFVTTTAYDKDSRVVRSTDALGNFTTYAYNARGDLVQFTDPDGGGTTYTYNVTNGKTATVMDTGRQNTTRYAYDLRGNLAATTDADQDTTTYAYDAFDRLILVTTPLGYTTKYVYDAAGNRIARTDGNGYTTKYAYDKSERLAATMYPGPPVYASPQTLTYTYDADGNMVKTVGFGYTETFGYDRSDWLAWEVFNFGTYSTTTKVTYDPDGNRKTMSLGTATTTYYYDKVDRLTGILDPEGQNTTFGYDRDSRQTSEKNPSGVVTTPLYDKASRLKAMYTNTSGGSSLESFAYGYDKAGYRTSETDIQNGVTTSTTYTYDKNHRLYKTTQGGVTTTDTYDAVGNVLSEGSETYSYDADNQLNYVYWSGVLRISYQYDQNGNEKSSYLVKKGGGDTFTYDAENRLMSSSGGCSYTYAPTGERAQSTCSATTTDLAYDPSSGGNLLATYTSSGTQTARYLDSGGLNSPVEVYEGGAHYAYQTDALGSVRMVTGGSQNATDTYAYDAWGNPVSQSGTLANPTEYTGSIYAPDINSNGYYDDRARFYDPSADGGHRFLSQDPLGGGYAYAGDEPLNFVDPSGSIMTAFSYAGGAPMTTGIVAYEPPPAPPKWQSMACEIADTLFVIGVILSVLGLAFESTRMLQAAGGSAGLSMAVDVQSIMGGWQGDPLGTIGALLDAAWIFITQIYIPGLSWLDAIEAGVAILPRITPPGFAASLVIAAVTNVLAFAGLVAQGCIPPLGQQVVFNKA